MQYAPSAQAVAALTLHCGKQLNGPAMLLYFTAFRESKSMLAVARSLRNQAQWLRISQNSTRVRLSPPPPPPPGAAPKEKTPRACAYIRCDSLSLGDNSVWSLCTDNLKLNSCDRGNLHIKWIPPTLWGGLRMEGLIADPLVVRRTWPVAGRPQHAVTAAALFTLRRAEATCSPTSGLTEADWFWCIRRPRCLQTNVLHRHTPGLSRPQARVSIHHGKIAAITDIKLRVPKWQWKGESRVRLHAPTFCQEVRSGCNHRQQQRAQSNYNNHYVDTMRACSILSWRLAGRTRGICLRSSNDCLVRTLNTRQHQSHYATDKRASGRQPVISTWQNSKLWKPCYVPAQNMDMLLSPQEGQKQGLGLEKASMRSIG